ncbi:MAG TPA: hypothetical protein VLJ60_10660, partial [bacterium]|nr:hypothetical protein [bacterium]
NENFLSPGKLYYHNYLVLLNAEIMVAEGQENKLISYLKKNLLAEMSPGKKEFEKISDVSEKLKEQKQKELYEFIKKFFKISVIAKE